MAFVQRNQAAIFGFDPQLTFDSSVGAGSTLIAIVSCNVPVEVSVTGVTGGGTWVNIGRIESTGGGPRELSLWACFNATGGVTSVSPAVSGTFDTVRIIIAEYSESGYELDQYAEAEGTGTAPSSGATGTTTAAVSLVIGAFTSEFTGTTFTGPGGAWTDRSEFAAERVNMIEQFATSAAAFTASGTYGSSDGWAAICATFKAAGATGGGPRVFGGATAGHRRNRLAA